MNPDFKNEKYLSHSDQLNVVDAIYKGIDSAVVYIQKYNKEEQTTYEDRQSVATLNNFVKRVVNSFEDIIFRKELDVSGLEGSVVAPYIDNIDYVNSLNTFSRQVLNNFELNGKSYILIDAPIYSENVKSKADEISQGLRPYMKLVDRLDILNWRYNEQMKLSHVTIREVYDKGSHEFEENYDVQYRVMYFGGRVDIWRDNEIYQTLELNYSTIPLVEVGSDDVPVLYDLAKININHMNRSSELNNYIRIGAAPIPITWGMDIDPGETKVIGVNQGINFTGLKNETGLEWVEMTGSNATMIREQIKADEEAMLDIAVTLVTSNQPRTATEVSADNVENESKLVTSADTVEVAINKALEFFAAYLNTTLTEEQKVIVNKDFNSNKLTTAEVQEYRADYLAGVISWDTLMEVLTKGKQYPEMSEEEKAKEKANLNDPGV